MAVGVQGLEATAGLPIIHVGRQPIVDREGDVVAYELLFRDAADATRATSRSAQATSQVIVSAFTDFGLEQLVGNRVCFINVTRQFLVGELPIPFDCGQAVLEIVETVDVDDEVVEGVTRLVESGFTIALDDFTLGSHERLLDLATYVKIDLLGVDPVILAETLKRCAEHPHVQLIAERLETEESLRDAVQAGFQLFQGHVLGRPHVVSTVRIAPGRLQRLQLVGALSAAEIDFDKVVALIAQDAAITYRLLQACNSAASGLATRVATVKEAAILLGLNRVREWVALMLLSELAEATEDQLALTMTRAKACENVAQQRGLPADVAFTTGLLSGVAELIGQSGAELASHLPLASEIDRALTDGSGELGGLLSAVRDYEHGDATGLAGMISADAAVKAYLKAVGWSTHLVAATGAGTQVSTRSAQRFSEITSPPQG
jgi:EAL and modified HD-GYP domain-containing signal transduction protein